MKSSEMVSVIIVNWNGKHLLSECLDGLREQAFRKFSTILVDNGSTDGSVDFVSHHYPEVEVIGLVENSGFATGNNIAIKRAKTKYIALLNNDAVPHPLWLHQLVEALQSHPQAGLAASKMVFYDNSACMIDLYGTSIRDYYGGFQNSENYPNGYRQQ